MTDDIAFNREHKFEYGVLEDLTPSLRRLTAPNPSPFTFHGTGTYVLGRGNVAVVDPGPAIATHVDALLEALQGETITHILVTHTHVDHSPACALLQPHVDAKTYGYGPHGQGKFEQGVQIEEGGDMDFTPDVTVRHGDVITGDGWSVECVYTPGHTSNHICYAHREEKALLSGDHVMGWSTSIVSPPDGDMGDYMRSLELLLERDDEIYWPTHGAPITNPKPFVRAFLVHRRLREQQVTRCIEDGVDTIEKMVPVMYVGLDERLYPAAARSVFATVLYMVERGDLRHDAELTVDAAFALN